MQYPLVSICIPTYNGGAYLAEALKSVVSQTYPSIEVVISDDASKDNTLSILQTFIDKTTIPIRVVHHKPNGIGANWNNCIKHAKGVFIKFLFQDDVLHPNCVEELVSVLQSNKQLGMVSCKRTFIIEDPPTEAIERWVAKYKNLQQAFETEEEITFVDTTLFGRLDFKKSPYNKIGEPPTVLFKKEIINEVGYFDEQLKQVLDYVFYYRILKKYPIAILNKKLVSFRIHENQATNVNRNKSIADYEQYDAILYREFYRFLHPSHKKQLALKFSGLARFKQQLKRVYRKFT